MSAQPYNESPLCSYDQLLLPFQRAEKPRSRWRVGTEAEKFGVFRDGSPVPYEGERSIRTVLEALADRHGWFEEQEYEGGPVVALRRGDASITLEPGGQLELSGAPHATIHATCSEFRGHMAELRDISNDLGIIWLGLGFHPTATQDTLPTVPKLRYQVMRHYLPTRGAMALDMMRRTCTVQTNLDYSDEPDAMRKLRLSLALQPIVTAMFANSPWVEGRHQGERCRRARVWLHMDPDRCGLLPFAWNPKATYRDYVEWALDVPMFMVKRGEALHHNTGQTFRSFMNDGFEGVKPNLGDWETHLNTLFPEARLKKTLELRGADAQDTSLVSALSALWKGLLYDDRAMDKVEALIEGWSYEAVEAIRPEIATSAIRTNLYGRPVLEWAKEILEIASFGLREASHLDRHGEDETIYLKTLQYLIDSASCPADRLLEKVDPKAELLGEILAHAEVHTSSQKSKAHQETVTSPPTASP
ncbi:MAG: glutamate-cysteine ligase family protein [Myxococcota bacterium]